MSHKMLMLYENGNVLAVSMLFEKNLKVSLDNDNKRCSDNGKIQKSNSHINKDDERRSKAVFCAIVTKIVTKNRTTIR